ncbi:3' terminal RNA ribose 2'-O-methyltransferase Hen1 [Saccharothrix tamanrassetensis]|uniref:Small RNA 2'-O-methyltransferase n=1 Tax=Saccharothrix tamanrassetensis TaxID=1051531 RepID=A0A841CUB6_9PSEU|nr:3' terminal RNA ribose 2'-O-methyltransferase Hen1 [Saccharothrix tamanrassetensis]MBB5959535.1 3' terminal RNA ribose 2'-O-methyltransferase Hen1 [Saccharothrix tamanrassetensis]
MLLTLTTTHRPATDLGHLLHKHPERAQSFSTSSGTAHVFYPRADEEECTVALLLEVDPVALVRGPGSTLTQYVNDRPYVANSLLTVALGSVFRTAMNGRSESREELAGTPIPLAVRIPVLPHRLVERLFTPLGWTADITPIALDEHGDSRYADVTLTGTLTLSDALKHLYVLLPVLDGSKHYYVAEDEVDKLLRAGEGWLGGHPDCELITTRYLMRRRPLVQSALSRLADVDEVEPEELDNALAEPRVSLAVQRREVVVAQLKEAGARRVLDLGCGGGALLRALLAEPGFTEIHGVDVSAQALHVAARKLGVDRMGDRQRARLTLRQSSLTYADPELAGYDAAVLMEVVEHLDPVRLPALEHSVFVVARPRTVLVTTPNVEYNELFETLPAGQFRHSDHRFEWTRAEFRTWADGVAQRRGYAVRHLPVGPADADRGAPTQLAVFTLGDDD